MTRKAPKTVAVRLYICFLFITEGGKCSSKHTNSWNPKRAVDLYLKLWLESASRANVLLKLWFRHTRMKLLFYQDILLFYIFLKTHITCKDQSLNC